MALRSTGPQDVLKRENEAFPNDVKSTCVSVFQSPTVELGATHVRTPKSSHPVERGSICCRFSPSRLHAHH